MQNLVFRALKRASWAAGNCSYDHLFLDKSNLLGFLDQVQDLWRVKNDNMVDLCKKVKELKGTFQLFQIRHVLRVGIRFSLCLLTTFPLFQIRHVLRVGIRFFS
jgi:hypothetical protein